MTMRSTAFALVTATTAICFFGAAGSASAGQGETVCTWGGTPAAPTGVATFSPGLNNADINSPTDLSNVINQFHPGDKATLTWIDQSGQQQSGTVTFGTGPPA